MAMSIPEGSDRTDKDHGLGVRVVLFTDKNEVPGIFKALAYNYRDFLGTFGLAFGWVQVSSRFSVQSRRYVIPPLMHI